MTRVTTIFIGLIFLTACDIYRNINGTVIDKNNKWSIPAATVTLIGTNNSTETDSTGNFNLQIVKKSLRYISKSKDIITISSPFYLTDTFSLNESKFKLQPDTAFIKKVFDPKNNFRNKWIYFNLNQTIKLHVLDHFLATMKCSNDIKTFSITIGTILSGDTIRVLELCNESKNFNKADTVYVVPVVKPDKHYTHPGVFVQSYQGMLRPSINDTTILKTTYGELKVP